MPMTQQTTSTAMGSTRSMTVPLVSSISSSSMA